MSKNDITGDTLVSKPTSATYADGWEMIYGKDKPLLSKKKEEENEHWLEEVFRGIAEQPSDHDPSWCNQKEKDD